jgi:tetratricopeptide (TPR) repeat protein
MSVIEDLVVQASYDPFDPINNFKIGEEYFKIGQLASAVSFYLRSAEYGFETHTTVAYAALLKMAWCFDIQKGRGHSSSGSILQAMSLISDRPEAYFWYSRFHERQGNWQEAYSFAELGLKYAIDGLTPLEGDVDYLGKYCLEFEKAVSGWWLGRETESRAIFKKILIEDIRQDYRVCIEDNLNRVAS